MTELNDNLTTRQKAMLALHSLDYTSDSSLVLQDVQANDRLAAIMKELKIASVDELVGTLQTGTP
jgi:hypothetical protein